MLQVTTRMILKVFSASSSNLLALIIAEFTKVGIFADVGFVTA